ncbi:hypothetical protein RM780_20055 [Streptomyces sp. DSM 44917]|uniref:Integral membrane protein n=1 Tax=Streptomyces boetiae TaxID=3075541 RepID=A0ABU2LD98_9ACTN|nr:hypothetical protein [Streptomyces sp. DSM 44917]MDT0309238.1 hypothetical protein [Streptomyces sp. DSM 44917]
MEHWWDREILGPGKLPLLLGLAAFVLTFLGVRCVTGLIRAGRGPFHDVSAGGHHLHHAVPGLVLMVAGGFGGMAAAGSTWAAPVAAVVFGLGAGLVLDEFALILYLRDVYWSPQGRASVEAVVVTTALVVMLLTGFAPVGVEGLGPGEALGRAGLVATVLLNHALVLVTLLKGKLQLAVPATLFPPLALLGAVRLARPGSPWARRAYRDRARARARAEERAHRHAARWAATRHRLTTLLRRASRRT